MSWVPNPHVGATGPLKRTLALKATTMLLEERVACHRGKYVSWNAGRPRLASARHSAGTVCMPRATAQAAIWARDVNPSLFRMLWT